MSVSFDQMHDVLQEKLEMQLELHDAKERLKHTLKVIRTWEWGTNGHCLSCARHVTDGHTGTCVIGIAVQWGKKT